MEHLPKITICCNKKGSPKNFKGFSLRKCTVPVELN
jgi:hypothetical protein